MSLMSVQVIGVGAPSGDDWLGWELAERLRASQALAVWGERVSVVLHDRPGAALLQAWRGGGVVVLLDAVRSGAAPGTVHRLDAAELTRQPRALSTHGFGVAEAVQLAAALDALPETLEFYGVEIDPDNRAMHMSESVLAVVPELVREIETRLIDYLRQPARDV